MASRGALKLGHGNSEICATAVVPAVLTRPWLLANGMQQRVVDLEGKVVFLVCEVGEHQCIGLWGALGELADVKGVSSLRRLHNL